jgi:hypothetical protein
MSGAEDSSLKTIKKVSTGDVSYSTEMTAANFGNSRTKIIRVRLCPPVRIEKL